MTTRMIVRYELFIDEMCVGQFAWYSIAYTAFNEACIANEHKISEDEMYVCLCDAETGNLIHDGTTYKEQFIK